MQPGTALAEFYRLSIAAMAGPLISSGVMTAAEEARLEARLDEPDFLGCGFAFIGAWGRRPALLSGGHDDDRAVRVMHHLAGHGAQAEPGESAAAAVADHDEIAVR